MLYVIDQVYSGLKYCPPHEANRKSTYSNAITDTLKACKRDQHYYAAKYYRTFWKLNVKSYEMFKAGELSKAEYERLHADCIRACEHYQERFDRTETEDCA